MKNVADSSEFCACLASSSPRNTCYDQSLSHMQLSKRAAIVEEIMDTLQLQAQRKLRSSLLGVWLTDFQWAGWS